MKTLVLNEFGPAQNLTLVDLAMPDIQDNEVLIKIKAISINPVDVKTRAGSGLAARMKEFMPMILGWDIAGTVSAVGKGVKEFRIGDDVFGMVNFPGHGKAYSEFVAAPADQLALKPSKISFGEAAAATLAALTAWQALVRHYAIKKGDRVFIYAASGGVGHFAVQIAKHFGAYVIGSSSAGNKDFVLSLGADEHFDYKNNKIENLAPVDFVLDCLGAQNVEKSLAIIKPGGSVVSILGGATPAVLEKAKTKEIACSAFLVHSNGTDMKSLALLLATGAIKSHVTKTYAFTEMNQAHEHVETGRTIGKVIVSIP
jgi:NADPH:quinone reductase-like Zn-dependent oxidoreductase